MLLLTLTRRLVVLPAVLTVLAVLSGCSTKRLWDVCNALNPCAPGFTCTADNRCVLSDGSAPDASDAGMPDVGRDVSTDTGSDGGSDLQSGCTGNGDCTDSMKPFCLKPARTCVGCLMDGDCTITAPACGATTHTCGPCATDMQCSAKSSALPYCSGTGCVECKTSQNCTADLTKPVCVDGACVACAMDSDCPLAMPACNTTNHTCGPCTADQQCSAKSAAVPYCGTAGTCVECKISQNCTADAKKPICVSSACVACVADQQCQDKLGADPGACLGDGHCAIASELVYVEFSAAGCPGADGTTTKPYCAPNDGVAALSSTRNVLVIRGAANNQLTLGTTGVLPIVIGRKNTGGDSGSILAGAATAIHVSSDSALIRDLTVNAGTTAGSKGIVITGASTTAQLLRVTASLGTGLGVDAEAGATLQMDHCTVQNNSAGGVLVNGAAFTIKNTTVTSNGPGQSGAITWGGILVNNPASGGANVLDHLTVQSNMPVGIACSAGVSGQGVSASGSTGGVDIGTVCGFSSCGTPSATCGAQP